MTQFKKDQKKADEVAKRTENYTEEEKQMAWSKIKNELQPYDILEGTIIVKAPFGVFLDVGKEFSALLRLPAMKDLNKEPNKNNYSDYQEDKIYNLGEKLQVYFVGMSEDLHDFIVTEYTKEYIESNPNHLFS